MRTMDCTIFYTRIDNDTNMPFAVDFVTFKVVDKKVAKRTAMQEQVLQPLRAYHQLLEVKANDNERGVFVLSNFRFLKTRNCK